MSLPYVVVGAQGTTGALGVEAPIVTLSWGETAADIISFSTLFTGGRTRVEFTTYENYNHATSGYLSSSYHNTFNVATQEFLFDISDGDITTELTAENPNGGVTYSQAIIGLSPALFPTANYYIDTNYSTVSIKIGGTSRNFSLNMDQNFGSQSSGTTICLEIGSNNAWLSSIAVGQLIAVNYTDENGGFFHTTLDVLYDGTQTSADITGVTTIVSHPYENNYISGDVEFKDGSTQVAFSNQSPSNSGFSTVLEILDPTTGAVTSSYNGVLGDVVLPGEGGTSIGIVLSSSYGNVVATLLGGSSHIRYKIGNSNRNNSIIYYNRHSNYTELHVLAECTSDSTPFCQYNPIENFLPFIPVPVTVTSSVLIPAVGGYVDIGHNVTVKSGGSLTLGVSDIGNVRIGAGYAIIAEPGGKVKLSGGHEITVKNGTLFKFRTVPVG